MMKEKSVKNKTAELLFAAAAAEVLRLCVLSRPTDDATVKETVRLCKHKGSLLAAFERQAKDGKVFHENVPMERLESFFFERTSLYRQIDILTPLGDAS